MHMLSYPVFSSSLPRCICGILTFLFVILSVVGIEIRFGK